MANAYRSIKRAMDVAVSLGLLLLLTPIFIAVALAIRVETRGPVFFCQQRVGRGLAVFRIVKFRSMVSDAAGQGPYWTSADDRRITRVGGVLRRTSIDELPQLWNVLVGEMSLIGPRPDTPMQETNYTPQQWHARHAVRPGITGLAQVNGRSAITPEERVRHDLAYAAAPSWRMDRRILQQTIKQVLGKVGVN